MLDLWNTAFFTRMNGGDAFLSQIPVRVQKEGDAAQIGGGDMDYKLCSVNFSFPARDAQGMSLLLGFGLMPLKMVCFGIATKARNTLRRSRARKAGKNFGNLHSVTIKNEFLKFYKTSLDLRFFTVWFFNTGRN